MFDCTQQALQFAYSILGNPIIKISSINSMRGSSGFGELTPQERHGQAAMIISIVEKSVDIAGQAYLRAHYGGELRGGEHENDLANYLVATAIGMMPPGPHSRKATEKIVRSYFGQQLNMAAVRRDKRCGYARANEYRDMVFDALTKIGDIAEASADTGLRNAGLINK